MILTQIGICVACWRAEMKRNDPPGAVPRWNLRRTVQGGPGLRNLLTTKVLCQAFARLQGLILMEKMRQNTWKITGKFEEMIGHVVFFPDVFLGAAVVFLIRTSAEQNEAKKKWRTPAETIMKRNAPWRWILREQLVILMDFVDGTNNCEQCLVISNKLCFNWNNSEEQ